MKMFAIKGVKRYIFEKMTKQLDMPQEKLNFVAREQQRRRPSILNGTATLTLSMFHHIEFYEP